MENIIKILLGEDTLKETGNTTLEDTIRLEKDRMDEIIPAEDVVKSFETIPEELAETRKGCELIVAYFGKYYNNKPITYREFYRSLKESEQLAVSEVIYNTIEEIKNMFSPAQA